jgi:Uma2 family endonuclease
MDNRKVVYYERQGVEEYWVYSDLHGFKEIDKSIGQTWESGSFDFRTITCDEESFKQRKYGYVPSRYS